MRGRLYTFTLRLATRVCRPGVLARGFARVDSRVPWGVGFVSRAPGGRLSGLWPRGGGGFRGDFSALRFSRRAKASLGGLGERGSRRAGRVRLRNRFSGAVPGSSCAFSPPDTDRARSPGAFQRSNHGGRSPSLFRLGTEPRGGRGRGAKSAGKRRFAQAHVGS